MVQTQTIYCMLFCVSDVFPGYTIAIYTTKNVRKHFFGMCNVS